MWEKMKKKIVLNGTVEQVTLKPKNICEVKLLEGVFISRRFKDRKKILALVGKKVKIVFVPVESFKRLADASCVFCTKVEHIIVKYASPFFKSGGVVDKYNVEMTSWFAAGSLFLVPEIRTEVKISLNDKPNFEAGQAYIVYLEANGEKLE